MYLSTTEGDVVEISLSQKKELHKNTYSYKIQVNLLYLFLAKKKSGAKVK